MSDVPLKEYIERLIEAEFASHRREHVLIDANMVEFKGALEARLDGLNHVKEATAKIEREFLRKETYDKQHDALVERLGRVEKMVWYGAGGVSLVVAILHFLK